MTTSSISRDYNYVTVLTRVPRLMLENFFTSSSSVDGGHGVCAEVAADAVSTVSTRNDVELFGTAFHSQNATGGGGAAAFSCAPVVR